LSEFQNKAYFCTRKKYTMNIEQVRDYTLSLYGVTEDQPFGDDILTFQHKKGDPTEPEL